jgi:hypothetical protein
LVQQNAPEVSKADVRAVIEVLKEYVNEHGLPIDEIKALFSGTSLEAPSLTSFIAGLDADLAILDNTTFPLKATDILKDYQDEVSALEFGVRAAVPEAGVATYLLVALAMLFVWARQGLGPAGHQETDPLGALRSRTVGWLRALATWILARWLVPSSRRASWTGE